MKHYYVTVKDGARTGWLLGPFATHEAALERVEDVRKYVCDHDDRAWFYAFGTSSLTTDREPPAGKLNERFADMTRWTLAALRRAEYGLEELCYEQDEANECWNILREVRAAIAKAKL